MWGYPNKSPAGGPAKLGRLIPRRWFSAAIHTGAPEIQIAPSWRTTRRFVAPDCACDSFRPGRSAWRHWAHIRWFSAMLLSMYRAGAGAMRDIPTSMGGHTIGMDTWYPAREKGNRHPRPLISDKLPTVAVSGAVADLSIRPVIEHAAPPRPPISQGWKFGWRPMLINGSRSNFAGELPGVFLEVWGITHVRNPSYSE